MRAADDIDRKSCEPGEYRTDGNGVDESGGLEDDAVAVGACCNAIVSHQEQLTLISRVVHNVFAQG